MAKRIWIELSNGKIKLWKESKADIRWRMPGHWYRNHLNRRERRKSKMALLEGKAHSFPHIHQRFATRF